jgi:ribosomal-protein-serine acetyltransferase
MNSAVNANKNYLKTYMPWAANEVKLEDSDELIEGWIDAFERGTDLNLGIFYGVVYIGNIGLHFMDSKNRDAMLGYWIDEKYQGKGIVTDCARVLVNYAFDERELNRVYIYCAAENIKSGAVAERLGFSREGVLKEGELLADGVFHDRYVYALTKRNRSRMKNNNGALRNSYE